ncbi:MAG TPA: hypothetical protein VJ650_07970 [Gemmatimonadaceae bacterium]|nr:hypothetical protein [Gemmatimonadaceae bacterium]
MADPHDHLPKPTRAAPPPFVGPSRGGALAPKARADRPTVPPFSPPFVKRPSPAVPVAPAEPEVPTTNAARPPASEESSAPPWLDAPPNEPTAGAPAPEVGIAWVNPDAAAVVPPPQAATGIEWLDSPTPEPQPSSPGAPTEDDDDPFGWDPAEERVGSLNTAPTPGSLEALKELEPWASPGAEPSATSSDEVAAALDRIAARIRSGDLFVPGALTAASEEAVLAAVLAALLQRSRG